MSFKERARQARTIAMLQLRRVFFSRRSAWVYVLALFPAFAFLVHGLEVTITRSDRADSITPPAALSRIEDGATIDAVLEIAGEPMNATRLEERTRRDGERVPERRWLSYWDGRSEYNLYFEDGILKRQSNRHIVDFAEDRMVYAAVFQYFYLRLAIFFGCLGIFMNLFRGEMLDETLHFWFLVPARRDVLLAGKYIAGLVAAVFIFTAGAAASYLLMLWPQEGAQLANFWPDPGLSHLFWYCAAAALACVGYGSVFLAAGLLLRNPIVPAVVLLFWEGINGFLPGMLQKLSVLHYVQALMPVPAPMDDGAPLFIQLLMTPPAPPSALRAIVGLLLLTAVVLWAAAHAVRRLEINYSTD